MSSNLLEVVGLSKKYGNLCAMDDVSFQVEPGRIVGLLGPNGSGKTTLIKLLSGLLTPTAGSIKIRGLEPGVESKALVSYLPDKPYFGEWMKVSDMIDFFVDFYKDFDRQRAEDLCRDMGISLEAKMKTLSKGNKEKVQLILAMSRKASLYLLDEPIGGVDPAAREVILKTIIANYNVEGSIIISTHLISDVEKILDDAMFIKNGKLVLYGGVDDIRQDKGASLDELFKEMFKDSLYGGN